MGDRPRSPRNAPPGARRGARSPAPTGRASRLPRRRELRRGPLEPRPRRGVELVTVPPPGGDGHAVGRELVADLADEDVDDLRIRLVLRPVPVERRHRRVLRYALALDQEPEEAVLERREAPLDRREVVGGGKDHVLELPDPLAQRVVLGLEL